MAVKKQYASNHKYYNPQSPEVKLHDIPVSYYIMMLTCCYVFCYLQSPGKEGMDVYDTLLTQAEIQGNITQVNDVIRKKKAEEACKFVRLSGTNSYGTGVAVLLWIAKYTFWCTFSKSYFCPHI